MKSYFVYALASDQNGTLYIGMTSCLARRMREHKAEIIEGFTKRYHVHLSVHCEQFGDVRAALTREKQASVYVALSFRRSEATEESRAYKFLTSFEMTEVRSTLPIHTGPRVKPGMA